MKFELIAMGEVKPDFLSRRIQAAIKADYSHVAILVDGYQVFHATGKGFHKSDLPTELEGGKTVIRRRIEIPVERECCALAWLNARLGLRYSNLQYLGFIFPFLRWIPFVNNGRSEVVCSEVVADFVAENAKLGSICAMAFRDCDFVDPKQCVDIVAGVLGCDRGH